MTGWLYTTVALLLFGDCGCAASKPESVPLGPGRGVARDDRMILIASTQRSSSTSLQKGLMQHPCVHGLNE